MQDCGCPDAGKYVTWSGVEVFHTGNGEDRHSADRPCMKPLRFTDRFKTFYNLAIRLSESTEADAVLLLLDGPADWTRLKNLAGEEKVIVAANTRAELEGAKEAGLASVVLNMADSPVYDQLTQALLEAVADDILAPGSWVVAMYSGFDAEAIDSISVINLGEHLDRLTGRDLRQLETSVPLDTLKIVVDLAVEIGREGREGKPVGTMFVVGDTRKVLACSHPEGFDPVRGYSRKERNLHDPRVREGIKEIAQMDGAIIVSADGTVEAACRYIDSSADHHALQRTRLPPLGRRRHQPGDQSRRRHGQPVQRHRPDLPRRRGRAPHRAHPSPPHGLERPRVPPPHGRDPAESPQDGSKPGAVVRAEGEK